MATISSGNDAFIGELIAEALDRVGADGVLSIETGNSLETTVDVQEGMQIDRGYRVSAPCQPALPCVVAGLAAQQVGASSRAGRALLRACREWA